MTAGPLRGRWGSPWLRVVGSVWMAVPVVLALAAALAAGTWYEARFGTPAAQRDVYRSGWFFLLQLFLALNLAVAALRRWPWQRRHAGFVMVHAGIITLLAGGLLGAHLGVQGELIIPEQGTEAALQLAERVLVVHQPNPGIHALFPTAFETRRWQRAPGHTFQVQGEGRTYQLTVDRYFPNAVAEERVVAGAGGPAARVEALGGPSSSLWLWGDDPARQVAAWGPLHVGFFEATTPAALAALGRPPRPISRSARGTLVLTLPWGPPHRVAVAGAVGRPVPLPGTPYTVTIQRYFADLRVTADGVVNQSDRPRNPAVAFTIADGTATYAQIALARAPGFAEAHGLAAPIPVRAVYDHPLDDPPLPPHLLGVVRAPGGRFQTLITDAEGDVIQRRPIAVGETLTHPALGAAVRFAEFLPSGTREVTYRPGDRDEVRRPVLHLTVTGPTGRAAVWLPEGIPQTVPVDDHPLVIEYAPRRVPLPFAVTLQDFRKRTYPGTTTAASFESEVTLRDAARGVTLHRVIRMNGPLTYRGYTLFQASYSETPVETTVLSVRNDPGVPLVYAGFVTVIAGLLAMFYWRPRR